MVHSAEAAFLVTALLSVNGYSVDRAYTLMPAFREQGILDPEAVSLMTPGDVAASMIEAGYDRGGFVPILSIRVIALMQAISAGALDGLRGVAASGKKDEFIETLSAIPGFGRRTATTAWELYRTLYRNPSGS